MGHSRESFYALIEEIMALGYDEATASKFASLIGDTPRVDETGGVIVLDDDNKELARLKLKSFSTIQNYRMDFYYIDPEVAGGIAGKTVLDRSTHPPKVSNLEYAFDGWLGDEMVQSFPCFLVTEKLSGILSKESLKGFVIADVKVTKSQEFEDWHPNRPLPKFYWLQITGEAGKDDFGVSQDGTLVVSKKALELIKPLCLNFFKISPYTTLNEGKVDTNKEHIKIMFDTTKTDFILAAVVTPVSKGNFVYQILVENNPTNQPAIKAVLHNLNFYLVEHPKKDPSETDPWDYAIYHCSTAANIYGDVHWGYYPANFEIVQNKMKALLEQTIWEEAPTQVEITPELRALTDERYIQRIYIDLLGKGEFDFKESTIANYVPPQVNKSAEKILLTMGELCKQMQGFLHLIDLRRDAKLTDLMLEADYNLFKDSLERIRENIIKKSFYCADINYCFYALEESLKAFGDVPRTGAVDSLDSLRNIKESLISIMHTSAILEEKIDGLNKLAYNNSAVSLSMLGHCIPDRISLLDKMHTAIDKYLNGKPERMQHCPICNREIIFFGRYPNYLCKECVLRVVNEKGEHLEFSNTSFSGGFIAYAVDKSGKQIGEGSENHICYVDGKMCWADEAHLGGIVVELMKGEEELFKELENISKRGVVFTASFEEMSNNFVRFRDDKSVISKLVSKLRDYSGESGGHVFARKVIYLTLGNIRKNKYESFDLLQVLSDGLLDKNISVQYQVVDAIWSCGIMNESIHKKLSAWAEGYDEIRDAHTDSPSMNLKMKAFQAISSLNKKDQDSSKITGIANEKEYAITKSWLEKFQSTVQHFDINKVAKKVGSKELAEIELNALKSQIEDLSNQLKEYENRKMSRKSDLSNVQGKYPQVLDLKKVGTYSLSTKSGAGYFYDDVLEYRVWVHPVKGGDVECYSFASYEEALDFSRKTPGSEAPLALVLQKEHISEPTPGVYEHKKENRITEWQVEWLKDNKRTPQSISEFLAKHQK